MTRIINAKCLLLIALVVAVLLSTSSCDASSSGGNSSNQSVGLTPDPSHHTFKLAWQVTNKTQITITPKIPPTQLNKYPSSYVNVTTKFKGDLIFSTDDPYYQCFEALSIGAGELLVLEEVDVVDAAPLFLVAYKKCGLLLAGQKPSINTNLAMIHASALHYDDSDYVIIYTFDGTPSIPNSGGHDLFPDAHLDTPTPIATPTPEGRSGSCFLGIFC